MQVHTQPIATCQKYHLKIPTIYDSNVFCSIGKQVSAATLWICLSPDFRLVVALVRTGVMISMFVIRQS